MAVLKTLLGALCAVALAGPAVARQLPEGARYVSLGSSYAAGPSVGEPIAGEPKRCGRSSLSYSRVLAARLRLKLVDMSCSGATTAHLLEPWNELAPQLDAVTTDTRLVTITVGGNDVRFVGNLSAGACAVRKATGQEVSYCPTFKAPTEAEWQSLAAAMTRIGAEARRRAPGATVVFIDYPTIVPSRGTCVALGVSEEIADAAQATARRLSTLTAVAARQSGARFLAASAVTRGHDACAAEPWSEGATLRPGGVPMHPMILAHAAVAAALQHMLETRR